jgi:hypothetical protein
MKKLFVFFLLAFCVAGVVNAAARDGNSATRQKSTPRAEQQKTAPRAAAPSTQKVSARTSSSTVARSAAADAPASRVSVARSGGVSSRSAAPVKNSAGQRNATAAPKTVAARAAADDAAAGVFAETRTGAEYEQCKTAYFSCMDQFCMLKNDDYRRCSCSDRIYSFADTRTVMQDAGEKLTVFTEGLDAVGMTASQATAMRTASEGEDALTADGSASKALLQAIMNSIRGEDTSVGGKFADLNSISLSFDTAGAFGNLDSGQAAAAYNGKNLYTAVYGQCRNMVKPDCNDASLQRAVTAYLMAVEQDCNTVQASIDENKKKMTAAVREGGAMLDLARIENRQKHNSDDMTACLDNVEAAVLSEEVCGANYHKCLDNGEFIDIATGAPIAGVVKFYELEDLLKFDEGASMADQRLSKISSNRTFVQNFEKRVKKFAQPSLDKCVEKSDLVWSDYLDKAMLDIYYSQKSKVAEIKQGCFDFVSSCYMNNDDTLTQAMKDLVGDPSILLQPDVIVLNSAVCKEYVSSCDNMFDGNIVKKYIDEIKETDTLTACRAVAKQCFDRFGGTGYENFYNPYSGLFKTRHAIDWFTLYEVENRVEDKTKFVSECAKQLAQVSSCSPPDMMEKAFGGLNRESIDDNDYKYGLENDKFIINSYDGDRKLRPSGVATEIYYQIIDILKTQCLNVVGRFTEVQFLPMNMYNSKDYCQATFNNDGKYNDLVDKYRINENIINISNPVDCKNSPCSGKEDMCPKDYRHTVDTQSWGACLCWENGARRSKNGESVKCLTGSYYTKDSTFGFYEYKAELNKNKVCPEGASECSTPTEFYNKIPEGIK